MPDLFISSVRFSERKLLRGAISSSVRRPFCGGSNFQVSGNGRKTADDWHLYCFSKQACEKVSLYRFFCYKALEVEIHLPGEWKKETYKDMKGKPVDHQWDQLTEMCFADYDDWKVFIN